MRSVASQPFHPNISKHDFRMLDSFFFLPPIAHGKRGIAQSTFMGTRLTEEIWYRTEAG